MSTRCNVLVRYNEDQGRTYAHQYYHHTDGYPEGVGRVLDAYITAAQVSNGCADVIFKMLLASEGRFEDEGYRAGLHSDIEYLWYVDLTNYKLTYTRISAFDMCPFDEQKEAEYFKELETAKEGETEFKTEIVK